MSYIAEITVKRIDDSDQPLLISVKDGKGNIKLQKTIGHKIGCNHKTILIELEEYEGISVVATKAPSRFL